MFQGKGYFLLWCEGCRLWRVSACRTVVRALETGPLFVESLLFYAAVEKIYGIEIEFTFPDTQGILCMVLVSFYEEGQLESCQAYKVLQLKKLLRALKECITGWRKYQSPWTRSKISCV